jgi:4-azaleucine resistance transporter AzlC
MPGPITPITFGWDGVRAGFARTLPVALGVAAYGLVYGVLARQAGLSLWEGLGLSGLVFAGASQFVALDLWVHPLPVSALIFTTLAVNLRHVLMGATLRPWFGELTPLQAYGSMFFMVDEGWALTLAELNSGGSRASFLLGAGLALYAAWVGATGLGMTAGALLGDPARLGMDFAFTAMFLALLAGMWRGSRDLLPWLAAGAVALVVEHAFPGKWHIVAGGLAGGLTGALRHGR